MRAKMATKTDGGVVKFNNEKTTTPLNGRLGQADCTVSFSNKQNADNG